jgi:Membrane-bound serine protease (ClpP class)
MDILVVILLCLLGLILIMVEIFLIPGVTITALVGAAFSIGGIYYAFTRLGVGAGVLTLLISILAIGAAFIYLVKSKALDKTIGLKTNIDSSVASGEHLNIAVEDIGITISRLNPIGKVKVNGITFEAKSLNEFIDEDVEIVVLKVTPTQLIVKQNILND